jgi:hypothetical protein
MRGVLAGVTWALAGLASMANAAVVPARTIGNSMVLSTSGGVLWGNLTGTDVAASSITVSLNGGAVP